MRNEGKIYYTEYYCENKERLCRREESGVCAAQWVVATRGDARGDTVARGTERTFSSLCLLVLTNLCGPPGEKFYITWPTACERRPRRSAGGGAADLTTSQDGATAPPNSSSIQNTILNGSSIGSAVNNESTASDGSTYNDTSEGVAAVGRAGRAGRADAAGKAGGPVPSLFLPKAGGLVLPRDIGVTLPKYVRHQGPRHECPRTCPDIYEPSCLQLNRYKGPYAIYMMFQNHCMGDMYYCYFYSKLRLIRDPGEQKPVDPPASHNALLYYKMCASEGYIARFQFVNTMNSLHRLGWLEGEQRATHIMTAADRLQAGTYYS